MPGSAGRRPSSRALFILPAVALLLAGCAGDGVGGGDGNVGPMGTGDAGGQGIFGSSMETTTVAPVAAGSANPYGTGAGAPATSTPAQAPAATSTLAVSGAPATTGWYNPEDSSEFTCPGIQVRGGAAAWQVTDSKDGRIRYQATLGQFSRECRFTAPDMNMRIGIQGRVLLGPAGGPGRVNVPIRLAVVEEGPAPKSIWTKFYSVPVEIGEGVMQVDFGLVADDVNFPRPTPALSDRYVVYVGFDPQGATESSSQRPRQQTRPRPQAQTQRPASQPARSSAPAASSTPAAAPSPVVESAPVAPAAPAPAASAPAASTDQWIGAPAPSAGGFAQ